MKQRQKSRRGSMVIEAVIASMLFATAVIAVGKLASTSAKINGIADQKLAAKLTAQNAVERINVHPGTGTDSATEIAQALTDQTGMQVEIKTSQFDLGDAQGEQVTVQVATDNGSITHHDWIIAAEPEKDPESKADSEEKPNPKDSSDSQQSGGDDE